MIQEDVEKLTKGIPPGKAVQRILVVDDNEKAAQMLAQLLVADGYEVFVAHDGDAALSMANEFFPDAIILDVDLPKRDGYEVARILKENNMPMLLIALTGYFGRREDKMKAREVGFDYYLTRPVLTTEIEMIFRHAGRYR